MYRLRHKETKQIATPDELKYLRVNTDGVVERLGVKTSYTGANFIVRFCGMCVGSDISWQPAPEWEVLLDEVNNG